jgi:hypothetical protein
MIWMLQDGAAIAQKGFFTGYDDFVWFTGEFPMCDPVSVSKRTRVTCTGTYWKTPPPPRVLGSVLAGKIMEKGENYERKRRYRKGRRDMKSKRVK